MRRQVELQYFVTMDAHHRAYCHNQTHPLLETVLPSANKLHHVHHLLLIITIADVKAFQLTPKHKSADRNYNQTQESIFMKNSVSVV